MGGYISLALQCALLRVLDTPGPLLSRSQLPSQGWPPWLTGDATRYRILAMDAYGGMLGAAHHAGENFDSKKTFKRDMRAYYTAVYINASGGHGYRPYHAGEKWKKMQRTPPPSKNASFCSPLLPSPPHSLCGGEEQNEFLGERCHEL